MGLSIGAPSTAAITLPKVVGKKGDDGIGDGIAYGLGFGLLLGAASLKAGASATAGLEAEAAKAVSAAGWRGALVGVVALTAISAVADHLTKDTTPSLLDKYIVF